MINQAGWGIACALSAAALYGTVPNAVRGAFLNGIPPVESTLFRTSVIGVMLALLAVWRGQSFHIPRQAIGSFMAQALATFIVSVSYLASVQFIPVGLAVIIFFFFPVLIMITASVTEGHSPGPLRILLAVVAFAGLVLAIGPSFESLDIRGLLLAAAAAAGAALQFFSGRSISRYMKPSVFGSLVHVAIWPAVLAVALVAGGGQLQFLPGGSATGYGMVFIAALAIVYVVAYMAQMLSLRYAPASTVAPFYNLEPVVTTVIAATILGETMQWNQYSGGVMVLGALLGSSFLDFRKSD